MCSLSTACENNQVRRDDVMAHKQKKQNITKTKEYYCIVIQRFSIEFCEAKTKANYHQLQRTIKDNPVN